MGNGPVRMMMVSIMVMDGDARLRFRAGMVGE